MRIPTLALIAVCATAALAQAPNKGSQLQFPFRARQMKITAFQAGHGGGQPDIYVLENATHAVEIQCGRELVMPKRVKKTLNCSFQITDKMAAKSYLYGINDFYQKGTEEFFRGLSVNTEIEFFLVGSLSFSNSIMMVVGGELRTYRPFANEEGVLVEAQVAPVNTEKSSQK